MIPTSSKRSPFARADRRRRPRRTWYPLRALHAGGRALLARRGVTTRRRARTSTRTRTPSHRAATPSRGPCRHGPTFVATRHEAPTCRPARPAAGTGRRRDHRTGATCRRTSVGEHGDRPHLSDCLAHQHARQSRSAREVSGKEPLVTGESPLTCCADTWLQGYDLVDEQKRWAMRQDVDRQWQGRHSPSASSSRTGVSFGLILYHALRSCRRGRSRTPTLDAHVRLAVVLLLLPHSVRLGDRVIEVGQQVEVQRVLVAKRANAGGLSGLIPRITVSPTCPAMSRSPHAC